MISRSVRILSLLLLLGLFAAPVQARTAQAPITVVDDHHTRLTLAAPPRRIISLAPNVTEILFALGLGRKVVGVSSYSNYPKAATKLPVVFDITSVHLEKILALKPDLVVAAAIVPSAVIVKLRSLHLKVFVTDPKDIQGILSDIRLVGVATGASTTAGTVVAGLQRRLSAVRAAIRKATSRPRVFYELDSTLFTAAHGSFMDAMITLAGGVNVARGVSNPYPQLTNEKVITANPQYIILGDAAYGMTAAKVGARPGWSLIAAVKLHHIYPFNDDLASRPGPRIVDGLERLARLLHPELFR